MPRCQSPDKARNRCQHQHGAFGYDSGRDCESSVKADPGLCDYWRYSECCGECVAQGLADGPASAWQYDGAGAGRRRRLGDDGKKGTYTVKLVARTTDGESVLSASRLGGATCHGNAWTMHATSRCQTDHVLKYMHETNGETHRSKGSLRYI